MGPGRVNMKQPKKITKNRSLAVHNLTTKLTNLKMTQSFLDAKGNIFIKRRKRKSQELLITSPEPKHGKIVHLSSKLLKLSRLNKMLLVLIVVCIFVLYANLEHLIRRANFAFLLPSSVSFSGALNATGKPIDRAKDIDQSQESLASLAQHIKPLALKFLPQHIVHHDRHGNLNHIGSKTFDYNIFVIYTKENYQLHAKFELFTRSLLKYASIPLHLHVITDRISKSSVEEIIVMQRKRFRRTVLYTMYDVQACAEQVVDIVSSMRPYFSATPKSYYGDALFYLSLGLHRIADENLDRVVLLDCDIVFRSDVRQLFAEFAHFSDEHLFGLAPELTPVYRHILYRYRINFPGTNFGNPYYPLRMHGKGGSLTDKKMGSSLEEQMRLRRRIKHGYPGLNSGVVLLRLERIRASQLFNEQLLSNQVQHLTEKYSFRGHLGDQDFFTLFGYEFPHLIYRLDCIWNRQLCTWWKNHGYSEVFDAYFHCEGRIRMYHGNCNTRVPE